MKLIISFLKRGKIVFVSDNIPKLYGLDSRRLFIHGHQPVIEVIHPDDIDYGLLVRKKIYSILRSFSNEEKKSYKAIHEMRIRNIRGEYIRIIEQEQIFIDLSDTLDEPLTNRELEVLRFMKKGLLSKEIAETLKVSINTVNSHRQNILQKLKANNSIEAVNFAQRLGLFNKYSIDKSEKRNVLP